jgi:hypothetical protein
MNLNIIFYAGILISGLLLQSCNRVPEHKEQIAVNITTNKPGQNISEESVGLSYETKQLLPDENGVHYFSQDNTSLLKMFKTLGVRNLRIGGNSVDASNIPIPDEDDLHSFFQFAKAAKVKVIYSVRLQDGDPKSAQQIAKVINENYSDVLESLAIGNEPSYYEDYEVYVSKWTAIRDAILEVYPDAVFCGPDQNPDAERLKKLVDDFGYPEGRLVQLTQHNYPFGCSYQNYRERDVTKLVPYDAEESIDKMLADTAYAIYEDILKGMVDAVEGTPITFRLSETNSFWYSGLKGASDRYASALWALDYMHWWTSHGAEGLNFHTGDLTGGEIILPCRYAAFVSSGIGYEAKPLAYGMKLFSLGGKGQSLPVDISSTSNHLLVAYANLNPPNEVLVTLINKAHKDKQSKEISIQFDRSIIDSDVEVIFLNAEANNIAATSSDLVLGNSQIEHDGTWEGHWQKLPESQVVDNSLTINLQPASAVLLRLKVQ